jgi:protein phosphatase
VIGFDAIEHHRTDVGVRRSHNQDALGVSMAGDVGRWREHGHLFVVADGMGGHAVGEKAAARAARDIPHLVPRYGQEGPAAALRKAYFETNSSIHAIGQENPEFRGLGTTATTLWLRPEGAWVAHVGDSRVYRLRGTVLDQLTFDHSAVWELARQKGVRPDQLPNVRTNIILRSLGPEPIVEADVEGPYPLLPGDTFLLCSDGLSGQVTDYEIGAILGALPAAEAADFLIELANLRGGPDNITAVIVRVGGEPPVPPAAQRRSWLSGARQNWPVWSMLAGMTLAVAALWLLSLEWPGSVQAFAAAATLVVLGLGGIAWQARRAEDTGPDEPKLNVYQRTRCAVEQPLVEKLARAEEAVRQKMSAAERAEAEPEVRPLRAEAEASLANKDLPGAFRAYCRAMLAAVRRYNRQHHKEEVFQPVWDKSG